LKEAGYVVKINPEKPRKGSFVITVESEENPLIELLDMPRPFKKLREFDLDAALADLLAANQAK